MAKVVLTERARQEYLAVIRYLSDVWTVKEIEKFEQKFLKAVSFLESNPQTFPISPKNTRKYVLDKNNTIFYRIKRNNIEIIAIWASKKNPRKLKI